MARFESSSAFCPHCQKQVLTHIRNYSTKPWLFLSIFTCGLFLLVWLVSLAIWRPTVRCSICGIIIEGGTPLQNTNIVAIGGIALCALVFIGFVFESMNSVNHPQPEIASTPLTAAPSVNSSTTTKALSKQSRQNLQSEAQARRQWIAQYQARKRAEGFTGMVCTVSGKNNTTVTIYSKAAIGVEVAQTLNETGYFDDIFEQGFTKIILTDDAGHKVTIGE